MDRREAITASNLGPVVSLLTWIMLAAVIIAVGIKLTLSSVIPKQKNIEDIPLLLATCFSIGFSIAMSLAVPNGIGRHQETLSSHQLDSLQKATYSANILLIPEVSCTQASVLILLHEITPKLFHRRLIYGVASVIALLFLPFFIVAIFPCHPPAVWRLLGDRCINQTVFWEAFAGANIVIETALVLIPIIIVYPLMMGKKRKRIVLTGFAARLAVTATFAAQLYEARRLKQHRADQTFHAWKYSVTLIFVQGLGIITVCIPYIRNALLGMESGMIQTGRFRLPDTHSLEAELPLRSDTNISSSGRRGSTLVEPSPPHIK